MFGTTLAKMRVSKGVTIIEITLVLAVAAIIIIMATRYYQSAGRNSKVNQAQDQISAVIAAATNWRIGRSGYNDTTVNGETLGITALVADGLLPKEMGGSDGAGAGATPWAGSISVTQNGVNSFTITFTTVDSKDCEALKGLYGNSANVVPQSGSDPCTFVYTD